MCRVNEMALGVGLIMVVLGDGRPLRVQTARKTKGLLQGMAHRVRPWPGTSSSAQRLAPGVATVTGRIPPGRFRS